MFSSDYYTHLRLQWIDSLPSFVFSSHSLAPQDFQSILLRLSSAANGPKSRWHHMASSKVRQSSFRFAMSCQSITLHLLWLSIQTFQLHVECFSKWIMFPVLISPGMPWAQPCHVKVIAVAATVLELTVEIQTSGKVRKLQKVRRTLPIAPLKAFNSGRCFSGQHFSRVSVTLWAYLRP